MDDREDLLRGGDSGEVSSLGDPAASPMIAAVGGRGNLQMPPKKRLTSRQVGRTESLDRHGRSGSP